jgi:hypothetical protein
MGFFTVIWMQLITLFGFLLLLELLDLLTLLLELLLLLLDLTLGLLLLELVALHRIPDREAPHAAECAADRSTRTWRTNRRADYRTGCCAQSAADKRPFLAR